MLQLKIRIGESDQTLKPIDPNEQPTYLNTNYFKGTIDLRIKGLTNNENYFNITGNTFCIHLHGFFLCDSNNEDTTADDIVFGNEFEKSLSLPFGFSIATKFAQYVDPGLELHLYEDQPYAFSPLITTLNNLQIVNIPDNSDSNISFCNKTSCNKPVEENCKTVAHQSMSSKERQTFFNNIVQRQHSKISSNMLWIGDFCNGFMDMLNGTIHIPGFTIDAVKYYNDQPLRYVCKKRDNSVVYFIIEFDLVK